MLLSAWRRFPRALLWWCVGLGIASACGVPNYSFNAADAGDSGAEAGPPPVPCKVDEDCAALDNATAKCVGNICQITECTAPFRDCDGDTRNGCEADLTSTDTCGSCDNKCSDNGGTPSCTDGKCSIECDPGHDDCANGPKDGCETDLNSSVQNCGKCGKVCPALGGEPVCESGVCGVSPCFGSLWDCNGGDDGCETDLATDVNNCGECGTQCFYPHGTGMCVNRHCMFVGCEDGYADCTSAAGCETPIGTDTDCSDCGDACTNPGGTTSCVDRVCSPICPDPNWVDCDGKVSNGCEANLKTVENCGACNTPCTFPHAQASCATGTCTMGTCDSGWGNCNATLPGCETSLTDNAHCGSCTTACTNAHGGNTCMGTPPACVPTCSAGWMHCTGPISAGCETNVATPARCGSCSNACSGATAYCVSGACVNPFVNSATGSSFNANLSIPHTLQSPRGSGRVVVLLLASDGGDGEASATPDPNNLSYDSMPFTLAKAVWSGNRAFAGIYYILDADLPAGTSHTVHVVGGNLGVVADVYELRGIDQTSPINAVAGSARGLCSAGAPSDQIVTTVNNSFIVSSVAVFGSEMGAPSSGQTETFAGSTGGVGFKGGYLGPPTTAVAGPRTIAWNMPNCNASAQALVAFKPAAP